MPKNFPLAMNPAELQQQQHRPPTKPRTRVVQDGEKPTCSKTLNRTPSIAFATAQTPRYRFPLVSTAPTAQMCRPASLDKAAQIFSTLTASDRNTPGSRIYVSNLHPSVDKDTLNIIFRKIGPIAESYVALEKGTKKSLGYGVVDFKDPRCVQEAVVKCNGLIYNSQKITVEVYRNPRERQNANLFVKNFGGAFSFDDELINMFRVYGPIESWKLERDEKSGVYKGFGFICFQYTDSAKEALMNLNGRILGNGKVLYVAEQKPKETGGINGTSGRNATIAPPENSPGGLFVGQASGIYSRQVSNAAYRPYNYATDYGIPQQISRRTVTIVDPPMIPLFTPRSSIGGGSESGINVTSAVMNQSSGIRNWKNNLYIKNISGFIETDLELFQAFRRFGKIISAVVMKNHLGISKGFGFVCFYNPEDAQTAIRIMNMTKLSNGKYLYCGEAQKKEERQVELRDKFRQSYNFLRPDFDNGTVMNGLSFIEVKLCNICFTEQRPSDCVIFDCNHMNCKSCLTNWITVLITERQVNSILCLGEGCTMEINSSLVKMLVSTEMYEKYDRILLENFLAAQSDIVHCPTPGCDTFVEVDYTQPTRGSCQVCSFIFCTNCTDVYHGSGPCDEFEDETEKETILTQYSNGSSFVKEKLEKRYGKQKLEKELETKLTNSFLTSNCKKCPNCKANIEKNGGCNHLECFKCKTHFCWKCLLVGSRDDIYTHFNAVGTTCQMII